MAALLFDLDGTLADTAPDLHAAMNHVLAHYGHAPIDVGEIKSMIGGGARAILQRGFAANGHDIDDGELDRATDMFIAYYDVHLDIGTKLYPNLVPVLEAAQAAGIGLAVVTNKREGLSAKLLFRLGVHGFFDTLIGGDTLRVSKPHPAPICEALRRLNTNADDAIMIGDSKADTASAQAANVATIAVSFGYPNVPLAEINADCIIDDYSELITAAKTLKPRAFAAL